MVLTFNVGLWSIRKGKHAIFKGIVVYIFVIEIHRLRHRPLK